MTDLTCDACGVAASGIILCGECSPPPADPAMLASANRMQHEQFAEAIAEIERLTNNAKEGSDV